MSLLSFQSTAVITSNNRSIRGRLSDGAAGGRGIVTETWYEVWQWLVEWSQSTGWPTVSFLVECGYTDYYIPTPDPVSACILSPDVGGATSLCITYIRLILAIRYTNKDITGTVCLTTWSLTTSKLATRPHNKWLKFSFDVFYAKKSLTVLEA